MTKLDELARRHCVIAVVFLGQLTYVQRTFLTPAFVVLLFLLMLASLGWANHRIRFPGKIEATFVSKILWLPILLVSFAISLPLMNSTGAIRLIDIANSVAIAALISQIAIVATMGIARLELLVLATIPIVLSLVCLEKSIVLYQQITEAGVVICLFALLSNTTDRSLPSSILAGSKSSRLVYAIVFLLVIIIIRPVAVFIDSWAPTLQLKLSGAIEERSIESLAAPSFVSRYANRGSLNDIVDQLSNDPMAIAIRVYSDQTPGYLRGTAFVRYQYGRWRPYQDRRRSTVDNEVPRAMLPTILAPETNAKPLDLVGEVAFRNNEMTKQIGSFLLDRRATGQTVTLEIENDSRRGEFYFLPLKTTRIDGVGRRLVLDANNVVQSGLDTRQTYRATVHQRPSDSPLSPSLRTVTLEVPLNLATAIGEVAAEVCGDAEAPRLKAKRISDFFQNNFRYAVERREAVKHIDPIVNFIKTRHAAHCEFFASAATLMLRSQGVPARYVTGYAVSEQSDETGAWLGRNINAHAWVEAHDERSNQWFIVEPTPGREPNEFVFESSQLTAESNGTAASNLVSEDNWFGSEWRLWILFRSGQWSQFFVELSEQMRWPLTATITGLGLTWFRRRRPLKRETEDEHDERYCRVLRAADREIKRFGFFRRNTETLHSFAARIENSTDALNESHVLATWYRSFAEARYQSLPPTNLKPFPKLQPDSGFAFRWLPTRQLLALRTPTTEKPG